MSNPLIVIIFFIMYIVKPIKATIKNKDIGDDNKGFKIVQNKSNDNIV